LLADARSVLLAGSHFHENFRFRADKSDDATSAKIRLNGMAPVADFLLRGVTTLSRISRRSGLDSRR
jgi:hypothetical protein